MLRFWPSPSRAPPQQSEAEDSFRSMRSSSAPSGDDTNYYSANSEDAFEYTDVSDNSSLGSAPAVVSAFSLQTGTAPPQNGQVLEIASQATPVRSNQSANRSEKLADGKPRFIIRGFASKNEEEDISLPLQLLERGDSAKSSAQYMDAQEGSETGFDQGYDEPSDSPAENNDSKILLINKEWKESKPWVKCLALAFCVLLVALIVVVILTLTDKDDASMERGGLLGVPEVPSVSPVASPTKAPSRSDIFDPPDSTPSPTIMSVDNPTLSPVLLPATKAPTIRLTSAPTRRPTVHPAIRPTNTPTTRPTLRPSSRPVGNIELNCSRDSNELFTINRVQRGCAWLATTQAYRRILCEPENSTRAFFLCPKTCNSCRPP